MNEVLKQKLFNFFTYFLIVLSSNTLFSQEKLEKVMRTITIYRDGHMLSAEEYNADRKYHRDLFQAYCKNLSKNVIFGFKVTEIVEKDIPLEIKTQAESILWRSGNKKFIAIKIGKGLGITSQGNILNLDEEMSLYIVNINEISISYFDIYIGFKKVKEDKDKKDTKKKR